MSTIQDLYQQAQLAEAAYANFINPDTGAIYNTEASIQNALIASGFSGTQGNPPQSAQATALVNQWEVIDQYTSDGFSITGDDSGFSATLFRNKTTDQYTFAVRGSTDIVADFMWADASLATGGIAIDQLVSMVNYVLRLDAGATGQTAQLMVVTPPGWPLPGSGDRTVVWSSVMVQGVGPNIPLSSLTNLTLTGHSLGGALAQMYQRIFGGTGVDTFNSVGIGYPTSPIFDQLTTMLGLPSGSFSSGTGDNLLVPGEIASTLPGTVMGNQQIKVFSETENTGLVDAHLMTYLTDSLAVYNLLATLDPSLNTASADNLAKLTGFLKASSNVAANSLENTLDTLRTLFQLDYLTGSPNKLLLGQADQNNLAGTSASAPTLTDNREALYANIQSLQTSLANSSFNLGTPQAPQYGFTLLTLSEAAGSTGLDVAAKSDLATRYALYKGNTFVLDATGYDLYTTVNANGSLDLYDSATHSGELTDQYLKDRAAFVLAKQKANTDDLSNDAGALNGSFAWAKQNVDDVIYLDKAGNSLPDYATAKIYQGNNYLDNGINDIQQIQFGSILDEKLTGGNKADHLYGMRGADILQGSKGNDYLEGGQGNDTYVYTSGDGLDTILDSDGNGSIVMDGAPLSGGDQFGDARVHQDAAGHHYVDVGSLGGSVNGMVIDGNIIVQNWQAGNLSLNMTNTPLADVISPTTNTVTNLNPNPDPINGGYLMGTGANDHIIGTQGVYEIIDASSGGNDFIEAGGGPVVNAAHPTWNYWSDEVVAGGGNDHLYADTYVATATAIANGNISGGSEYVGAGMLGGAGDDLLVGGAGNDYLSGGIGSDLIIGGAGNDIIEGSSDGDGTSAIDDYMGVGYGDSAAQSWLAMPDVAQNEMPISDTAGDVIYAGAGSDYVAGSHGNDVIFGENGNDALIGFGGNDVILGGTNDDIIYGDIPDNWGSVTPPSSYTAGNDYLDGGDGNDIIYGNGGDDILIGGKNDDTLIGGIGNDTYLYNAGDGVDYIYDNFGTGEKNVIRFGAGVDKRNVHLGLGSLKLDLGNGDNIHIAGFNQNDVFNSSSISSFEFADGTTLTTAELLARGFDLDGTAGDDTITGTNTTDRINGLGGNDTLIGGEGNDTLNGGTGNDRLIGGTGGDTYLFNRGDGQDIIADSGNVSATDTLQFAADILLGDVTITRLGNGDLSLTLNGSADQITVQGWYGEQADANRIERIMFGDGSVLTPADFENLPINGTTGDDSITGTIGNDTILGLAGNDVLDGGAGNDTLIGGEGQDTYRFGFGMGKDTVIDASTGGNTISLQAGMSFSDLHATQSGNDLLLTIRGTDQGMTIRDYYTAPQDWLVQDSAGAQQGMPDVLNAMNQDEYSALRDDYFTASKVSLSNYLLSSGYQWQADGSLYKSPLGERIGKRVEQQIITFSTTFTSWLGLYPDTATSSVYTTVTTFYDWATWGTSEVAWGIPIVYSFQYSFSNSVIYSDAAQLIDDGSGYRQSYSGQLVNAQINWNAPYNIYSDNYYRFSSGTVSVIDANGDSITIGESTSTYQRDWSSWHQDGKVVAIAGTASPSTTEVWVEKHSNIGVYKEIVGGASDNSIVTSGNTVVNGGAGNDTLQGGGLIYGGEGNDVLSDAYNQYGGNGNDSLMHGDLLNGGAGDDTLFDGNLLIGGTGNDMLTGGNVLVGGEGNDTMDGGWQGTGETRYLIDPLQTGIDLISGTRDSESAYKDWYYGSLGIESWWSSEHYGGKSVVSGNFANTVV